MAEVVKVRDESVPGGGGNGGAGEGSRVGEAVSSAVGGLTEYPRRLRQFLHEVRVEMKQVTWPTRDDVVSTTWVVIVTVFFFGAFLAGVDVIVSHGVERVFRWFK